MKVLSLFDGISCGQLALNALGFKEGSYTYYASEIEKSAISVTQHNFPDTVQLGDINNWRQWDIDFGSIDLVLAGSPCQGFSFAGKELNFKDDRSKLFFVFVDILRHIESLNKNVIFLLENVEMRAEFKNKITEILGFGYVTIDSSLFSAQTRKRLYWSNKPIPQPHECSSQTIQEIVGENMRVARIVGRRLDSDGKRKDSDMSIPLMQYIEVSGNHKTNCLTTVAKDNIITTLPVGRYVYHAVSKNDWRYLTPDECEQLQTVPVGYTKILAGNKRFKALGNGWTVSVISYILKHILK